MTSNVHRALRRVAPLVLVLAVVGCGKKLNPLATTNQLPIVRVTAAPIDTNATCHPDPARSCYSLTLDWVGYDPDGRVDHYQYAVDPPDPDQGDTTWIRTTDNEKRLVFNAPRLGPPTGPDSLTLLRGFHTFVIAAVDNEGAIGPRVSRSFFSFTKAPEVSIKSPKPTGRSARILPPSVSITWEGVDDDGVFTTKPIRYKYILLGPNQADLIQRVNDSNGAALRREFAPSFDGWTAVGGDTTNVQFSNLVPGATYLFSVVAFDEAGAFSPVFLFEKNIITFTVGFAAAKGPTLIVFNESFVKRFNNYVNSPLTEARIEAPAGEPLKFNWFAIAPEGANIVAYRWMVDGNVFDQTPRSDEATDLVHWSTPSGSTTSAIVGPFAGGTHYFYVDCLDNTGLRTLGIIHLTAVVATFDKQLLIVNDTRYYPDQFDPNGNLLAPQKPWPAAAELDTFLFAVGGKPWRKYSSGEEILSPPGVLSTYGVAGNANAIPIQSEDYDTLGSRIGVADIGVPLATLGQYRHVIWMTDFAGAVNALSGDHPTQPTTSLRFMSTPGHLNTLAAYIRQGGEAWLMGGGGALAALAPLDQRENNNNSHIVFDAQGINGVKQELTPGRFMYDVPKWQNLIYCDAQVSSTTIRRWLGRFRGAGNSVSDPVRHGAYETLPVALEKRTPTSDPLPPLRANPGFYTTVWSIEYLQAGVFNNIFEDVVGEPSDFVIDQFENTTAGLRGRWKSSDTLNTVVSAQAIGTPGGRASGTAMAVSTQGGGASTGDVVTADLGGNHDFSGLRVLQVSVKQDQPTSVVQWRIRLIDDRGNSESALLAPGVTGIFADLSITPSDLKVDTPGLPGSSTTGTPPRMEQIRKVQLELVRGDAAGATAFDAFTILTNPFASVVDTLMAAEGARLSNNNENDIPGTNISAQCNATMTVYHGHDFLKPFIFSGFGPWDFRRAECKQLFDFVLQKMWDISPKSGPLLAGRRSSNPTLSQRPLRSPQSLPSMRGGLRRTMGAAPNRGSVGLRSSVSAKRGNR